MTYYTHHSDIVAPHYACVHVSSDHSLYQMTYYTYHSNMVAHHYVWADIPGKEMSKILCKYEQRKQ